MSIFQKLCEPAQMDVANVCSFRMGNVKSLSPIPAVTTTAAEQSGYQDKTTFPDWPDNLASKPA